MFAVALVGAASACLPELSPLPPAKEEESPVEASTPFNGCGDGIIATSDDGGDAGESCDPGGITAAGCTPECSISCLGVIGPSGHCYFLTEPSDYANARNNCSAAGGHVVTIGSEAEAALVGAFVDGGSYRVGLTLDNALFAAYKPDLEEPGWPQAQTSCSGCFAEGADDAGQFAELAPDSGLDHHCLVAAGGRWLQVACDESDAGIQTVCEREPIGQRSQPCGGPLCATLASTAGRKRYVISLSPATAEQADLSCSGYEGGSLVVFESREEREELAREIRALLPALEQHPVVTAWIGLAKTDDAWRWDDGRPEDAGRPLPWANAQPAPASKGRAYMRLDVHAFDTQLAVAGDDDSTPRLFVCQRPLANASPRDAGRD
jgi:hypothetical protein